MSQVRGVLGIEHVKITDTTTNQVKSALAQKLAPIFKDRSSPISLEESEQLNNLITIEDELIRGLSPSYPNYLMEAITRAGFFMDPEDRIVYTNNLDRILRIFKYITMPSPGSNDNDRIATLINLTSKLRLAWLNNKIDVVRNVTLDIEANDGTIIYKDGVCFVQDNVFKTRWFCASKKEIENA